MVFTVRIGLVTTLNDIRKITNFISLLPVSPPSIEVEIPRGRIGLNYLSKFVCTQWAV